MDRRASSYSAANSIPTVRFQRLHVLSFYHTNGVIEALRSGQRLMMEKSKLGRAHKIGTPQVIRPYMCQSLYHPQPFNARLCSPTIYTGTTKLLIRTDKVGLGARGKRSTGIHLDSEALPMKG